MKISYRPTTPKTSLPNGKPLAPPLGQAPKIPMPRMGTQPIPGEPPMRKTPTMKIKYTPTAPPAPKAPMEGAAFRPNEPNPPKGPNDAPQRTPMPNPKGAPGPKGDPSGGRGFIPPPQKLPVGLGAKMRTHETLADRAKRLQGRIDAGKGNPRQLNKRIGAINTRIAAGKDKPRTYDGPKKMGGQDDKQSVQLDDKPETWTPDKLSELAPPRGYTPSFKDVGNYSATEGREQKLKKEKRRLKARVKANQKSDNKKPAADAEKDTGAPESAGFQAGEPDPSTNNDPSKKDNKLKKKLRRVKRKLGRIDNANNRPQPGTPKRPFRNRGTTYQPIGFGGSLRV